MTVAVAPTIHAASLSPPSTGSLFPYFAQMSSASALRMLSLSNESTPEAYR